MTTFGNWGNRTPFEIYQRALRRRIRYICSTENKNSQALNKLWMCAQKCQKLVYVGYNLHVRKYIIPLEILKDLIFKDSKIIIDCCFNRSVGQCKARYSWGNKKIRLSFFWSLRVKGNRSVLGPPRIILFPKTCSCSGLFPNWKLLTEVFLHFRHNHLWKWPWKVFKWADFYQYHPIENSPVLVPLKEIFPLKYFLRNITTNISNQLLHNSRIFYNYLTPTVTDFSKHNCTIAWR